MAGISDVGDPVEDSPSEIGDFKLADWRPGSETGDYLGVLDLQGVRREWVVGFVGLES